MNKQVYMDYSATTYTKPEVLEEMLPFLLKILEIHLLYILSQIKLKSCKSSKRKSIKGIKCRKMRYSLQVVVQKQTTGL